MTPSGHLFRSGGRCVWCNAPREVVDDRRAPPWCPERPDDTRDDPRDSIESVAGY